MEFPLRKRNVPFIGTLSADEYPPGALAIGIRIVTHGKVPHRIARKFHVLAGEKATVARFVCGFDFRDCPCLHVNKVAGPLKSANEFSVMLLSGSVER